MSKAIVLIGGGKGGVGKSLFSMAVVDFLDGAGRGPFLVETDTSVPDVFKTYKGTIDGELVNLDEREGWIDLVNLVESRPDDTVVINTGARNQTGISNFGRTLRKALPALNRKLVVFWLIDRKRESLELLADFAAALPEAEVHVVRNMYLGAETKFELYNGSKMRAAIEGAGGKIAELPRARGQGYRRHEQRPADDREGMRRAIARRPDGGRAVAGGMHGDARRGDS